MTTQANNASKAPAKEERSRLLRQAYEKYLSKLQDIRKRRLAFMESELHKNEEKRIEEIKSQLSE